MLSVTAARGVGLLVGRTLTLQALTAGVTVALARLLTPADYGLFAIALAAQLVGQRLAELGLPSALIRERDEPAPELQRAVAGLMLATATAIAVTVALVAFAILPAFGVRGKVVGVAAVAMLAMPIYALRALPMVFLERHLRFERVALIETVETLVFNGFALVAAIAGLGAFSLAGAVPAGALAGLATALAVQPIARGLSLDLRRVRPLIRFGAGVTALQGLVLVRDLVLTIVLLGVGGAAIAGFYSMSKRLWSFPVALNSAVFRVSFPALSRDEEAESARRAARTAASTATVLSLPLALVAGAAGPLIVVLLGERWLPTEDIVLVGSIGMMLATSAGAALNSFALSQGHTRVPLVAASVEATTLLGGSLLVIPLGAVGVGIAMAVSETAAAGILAARTHPLVRRALPVAIRALLIAAAATAVGQLLPVANDLAGLILAVSATFLAWLLLQTALARDELVAIVRLARQIVRRLLAGSNRPIPGLRKRAQ